MSVYIGNSTSLIVHAYDCGYAVMIDPLNFEIFPELHNALGDGYRECGWCIGGGRMREYLTQLKLETVSHSRLVCICCSETRGVQRAHITPRSRGGVETMPLCPTCHWNYDHDLLKKRERSAVRKHLADRRNCGVPA